MLSRMPCTHTRTRRAGLHFPAVLGLLFTALLAAGCQHGPGQESLPPPEVTVGPPTQKELIDYERFTGRTVPVEQVEIRARVSGYLTKIQFKAGAEVEKDQPLFEIDPRIYRAAVDSAQAEVDRAEARVGRLAAELERNKMLLAKGGISQQDYDKSVADLAEGKANVKYGKAQLATAKLDVDFTTIEAPLSGVMGDWLVTEGNLVTGGQGTTTLLTTIVAVDPMDAVFNLDENTLQRLQKDVREGRIKLEEYWRSLLALGAGPFVTVGGEIPVEMGLSVDASAYPYKGTINFVNNQVDPKTGTIKVKARFRNLKPAVGGRPLTAGAFARIRVPIGEAREVLVVPESSLATDQGQRYLYVVDDSNVAVRLDVDAGSLENGFREIIGVKKPGADEKSRPLQPNERVIVKGLQRVRPGMTVAPLATK
jgi:multidrug efflux system membrane fusion protein